MLVSATLSLCRACFAGGDRGLLLSDPLHIRYSTSPSSSSSRGPRQPSKGRSLKGSSGPGGGNFSCSLAPLRVTFPSIYFVPLMLPPKIYTFWTEHLRDYSGLRVTRNAGNSVFLARSPRFTVFLAPKARGEREFPGFP